MKRKRSPKVSVARSRKERAELVKAYTESSKEDRATAREWDATRKPWFTGGTIMNKRKLRTFNEVQIEHYKKHPRELKSYLGIALEEYQKDGDEKAFLTALSVAARVHGGFSKLAKSTGLNRENLYRALSERSDPRLSTVLQVLSTLGFSLRIC